MLPKHNMQHGVAAAALLWIITLLSPFEQTGAAGVDEPRDLPDAEQVVTAFLQMRQWADTLDPPSVSDDASRLPLDRAAGVHVIVRRFGRVVGSATMIHARSDRDLLARRALGRALSDALGDPAIAGLPDNVRDEIGTGLTLEVEVAGRLQPMLGRSFARVAREVQPGLEGVAMRRGNQWAMLFPSQLRASNSAGNLAARMPGLAVELGVPAGDLDTLVQRHGVSIYRFRTVHLAQQQPTSMPFETVRGDRVVSTSAVSRAGLTDFTDALAAHVLGRIVDVETAELPLGDDDQLGLLGDYRVVSDSYRPLQAQPFDQALTSFALSRYASTRGVNAELADRAARQAVRLLSDLAGIENVADDPAVAGAIVYAFSELGRDERPDAAVRELHERAATSVIASDNTTWPDAMTGSLVAGAQARLLLSNPDAVNSDRVRETIDHAWESVPEHQRVALLPWVGWAEEDYAAAIDEPLVRGELLRELRDILEQTRVSASDPDVPADLHGGFALADGAASRPTAQVTRPAAFLAAMLRNEELTAEAEASLALGRHLQTMRYLMQLSVRDASTWSMRNPDRALGGLRASTWDSNMPVAAQAMGLLTAAETLRSLDH